MIDANIRSRDVAKAHLDVATTLERLGSGSRLNRLRAAQEVSIDDGLIEAALFALYSGAGSIRRAARRGRSGRRR